MARSSTFLAPGQRYAPPNKPAWNPKSQLTVLQVYRGRDGYHRIAFHCPTGEVQHSLASTLEAEVEAGLLVPVLGADRPARC